MISVSTAERVLEVVAKRVSKETLAKIVRDLYDVPGNKSFRDSVERMSRLLSLTNPSTHEQHQ